MIWLANERWGRGRYHGYLPGLSFKHMLSFTNGEICYEIRTSGEELGYDLVRSEAWEWDGKKVNNYRQ